MYNITNFKLQTCNIAKNKQNIMLLCTMTLFNIVNIYLPNIINLR